MLSKRLYIALNAPVIRLVRTPLELKELIRRSDPAKTFFNTCVVLAGDDRDIDLYHWSSERFSAAWRTTISVLVAKGRARVGVAAAAADWPKRIRDLQFLDHEGYATAT